MKRIILLSLLTLILLIIYPIYKTKSQMTSIATDGKVKAVDVTNNIEKYIIVPIILNTVNVDLTNQSSSINSTTLYTVPSNGTGLFKITWVATITRVASISSVLGGTGLGLQVIYTNNDDSTLITTPANLSGAINVANLVGSPAYGTSIIYAKAGTNINYQMGYTSIGSPSMQYSLHIRLEALQ